MQPIGGPATQGSPANRSSRVEGIDYAPDGSIRSVFLRDGAFVHLSPELGRQAGEFLHKGVKLTVNGNAQTFARQTILEASSVSVGGRTFIVPTLPAGAELAAGTPPPPMPGAHAPRPEVERGPGGPGPIAHPSTRGPQSGGPAAPPPPPPPDRALNGDPNVRPGAPQPGSPVPPPPPAPAMSATPQSGAAPLPPPPPNAPTPQP